MRLVPSVWGETFCNYVMEKKIYQLLVVVSLSEEPHTSGTALQTRVYMSVCLLAAIHHKF